MGRNSKYSRKKIIEGAHFICVDITIKVKKFMGWSDCTVDVSSRQWEEPKRKRQRFRQPEFVYTT
jgi:hypothetical protein